MGFKRRTGRREGRRSRINNNNVFLVIAANGPRQVATRGIFRGKRSYARTERCNARCARAAGKSSRVDGDSACCGTRDPSLNLHESTPPCAKLANVYSYTTKPRTVHAASVTETHSQIKRREIPLALAGAPEKLENGCIDMTQTIITV